MGEGACLVMGAWVSRGPISCVRALSTQLRASGLSAAAGGSTREWSGRWVCLLPDDDDRLRDALKRNARIIDEAANSIASLLAEASIIETATSLSHLAG